MNFLHLFSCDTVGYWVYAEVFRIFAMVLKTCLLGGLFKQVHSKQSVSLPACLKTSRRQGF